MKYGIALILLLVLTTGCLSDQEYSREEVELLMQTELERRLVNFRENRAEQCYNRMLQEAVRRADSIMVVRAREAVPDPGRPERPLRPERRKAKDTVPVHPLFRTDTILPDTSRRSTLDTIGG